MKGHVTVAEYLSQQIHLSGKPQKDIAEALGYTKPNIITMFKQGKTKVPLNKIAALSKIIGVDPIHFLRIAMLEYSPEMWEVLEGMIGKAMISANEAKILNIARSAGRGHDIAPRNDAQEKELRALFASWAKEAEASAKPATIREK